MSTDGPVAVASGASFAYGSLVAVEDVSFAIGPGEHVCLVGRNGSGKSTLIKGLLGLIPPRSGRVEIAGGPDAAAFMPQAQAGGTDFPATVWEVVLSGRQRSGRFFFHTGKDRELARRSLAALDISDLAKRRVGTLSGGQRQRACLARCLCRNPRILLLDEPCAGLDPEAAAGLARILERLRKEHGIAILMSSHDPGAVQASASRVLVLDRVILFDGSAGEWAERSGNGKRHANTA